MKVLSDDSSEGLHLELELLSFRDASSNSILTVFPREIAGVTLGGILVSVLFSEKDFFPFRALKSDMIVFFATFQMTFLKNTITQHQL